MEIRCSGEVMRESSEVVVYYYSYKTPWNFLQEVIKSMLRRLGFTSESTTYKHQSPADNSPTQTQLGGETTHSTTEATFMVTSRSVATKTAFRKPPRKPVTSGRGPQTNNRQI